MSKHYILEGRKAVPVEMMTWATWLEANYDSRNVAKTNISDGKVSTVFLGLDHSYGVGPPLLFETMVFGGSHDGNTERCTTWEQAEAQHAAMVAEVSAPQRTEP